MKRVSTLLGVAVAALVFQGALATVIAPPWCPDLALLVLIGIGLRWRGFARGLVFAALFGYARDLLSGSLLGQHALLHLFAFAGTVVATRQLNLRGSWPLLFFSASLTSIYGLGMLGLTGFFVGGGGISAGWVGSQVVHGLVTGILAPAVSAGVGRAFEWADDEPGHRTLGLGGARGPA